MGKYYHLVCDFNTICGQSFCRVFIYGAFTKITLKNYLKKHGEAIKKAKGSSAKFFIQTFPSAYSTSEEDVLKTEEVFLEEKEEFEEKRPKQRNIKCPDFLERLKMNACNHEYNELGECVNCGKILPYSPLYFDLYGAEVRE